MSLVTARAVLLRSHAYGETSRVLRFFTDRHGVVGIMARGVRSAKRGSDLDTFAEGDLTYYWKETRELQTFKEFGVDRGRRGMGRKPGRLAAASILAELVLRHTGEADSEALFGAMSGALDAIADAPEPAISGILLREGWGLVAALGFRPRIESCIACGRALGSDEMGRMDLGHGGVRCEACSGGEGAGPRIGPGARSQLESLLDGRIPDDLTRPRAHLQLLSDFTTWHVVGGRPLDGFRIFAALVPADDA